MEIIKILISIIITFIVFPTIVDLFDNRMEAWKNMIKKFKGKR